MLFQARADGGVSVMGSREVDNSKPAHPFASSPQVNASEPEVTTSCGTVTDGATPEDSFESQGQVHYMGVRSSFMEMGGSRSDFSTGATERDGGSFEGIDNNKDFAVSQTCIPKRVHQAHEDLSADRLSKMDTMTHHNSSSLASLLPRLVDYPQAMRVGQAASDPAILHPWSSTDLDAEVVQSNGRLTKRRRPSKKAELTSKDDTDYEPGVRNYRSRKSTGAARQKLPGRARLTLAGIASTIGDVDPGWKAPHGSVVLVAKTLTKSDTLGRVILPRVAVETNMSFLTAYRAYSLAVRDMDDQPWEFVVKSWANGSEQRRVYVLEQASLFLRTNHLREGDIMGICCDEEGNLRVAANTPQLQEAVARPTYGSTFVKPAPNSAARKANSGAGASDYRTPFASRRPSQTASLPQGREEGADFTATAERPVRATSQLRSRRSSGSLESIFPPGKATSLPLTEEDIVHGRSRMQLTLKHDPAAWSSNSLSAKDDLGQTWILNMQILDHQGLVLLGDLDDFYKQQAARAGDCVEVLIQADGSKQLQLDPCQDTRPRPAQGRTSNGLQDSKRKASAAALDNNLLAIKCGQLSAHLDLSEGSVLTSSDLSTAMSVSMSDFQAQAGYDASDNWMQTVHVCTSPSRTTLEQWLHDKGLQTHQLKQLCYSFESKASGLPPSRSSKSHASWPKSGKRSSAVVRGGWLGRKLSDGSTASIEDSIAAEVLMSLSEQDFSPEVSEVKMAFQRARSAQLDSHCWSVAESAARGAESQATLPV